MRFRLIVLSIVVGVHAYLGARLLVPAPLPLGAKLALAALVGAAALLYPVSMGLRLQRGRQGRLVDVLLHGTYLLMGVTGLLLTLLFVRDLGWWGARLVDLAYPFLPDDAPARTLLLHRLNLGVLGAAGLLTAVGLLEARRTPRVRRVQVPIAGLPEALEGFTLVQLTDLHIGPTIKRDFVQAVVDRVNRLQADAVALTGDFVDGSVAELREHAAPLGELRAKHGAFYVTGNHEYYAGALPWLAHFRSLGLRTLINEHAVVEHEGERLTLAGIADYSAGSFVPEHKSDPARALAGAPAGVPRVLLAHQPRSAKLVREAGGVDLMLTGHTHGGQMWPWNLFVPLQQPLVAGLTRHEGMWVYVSRGTGYWGPPLRVGAPSEIALLTLVRG